MQAGIEFFTIIELAGKLRVSRDTVDRWVKKGLVKVVRLPGGHYRIPLAEVERLTMTSSVSPYIKGDNDEPSA
jgi:excisionase family DNA binding protein